MRMRLPPPYIYRICICIWMYMYTVHILYAGVGDRPKRYPWMPLLPAMIRHLQKRSTYMYKSHREGWRGVPELPQKRRGFPGDRHLVYFSLLGPPYMTPQGKSSQASQSPNGETNNKARRKEPSRRAGGQAQATTPTNQETFLVFSQHPNRGPPPEANAISIP